MWSASARDRCFFLDYVAVERLDPRSAGGARRRRGGRLPAGRLRADRRRDGRAPGRHGQRAPSTWPGSASASPSGPISIAEAQGRPGDALIGIAASGLHSNGFSLVRKIVAENGLDLAAPFAGTDAALGDALLTPTRIYAVDALALREELRQIGQPVRGFAHITGGGLAAQHPARTGGRRSGAQSTLGAGRCRSFRPPSPSSPA